MSSLPDGEQTDRAFPAVPSAVESPSTSGGAAETGPQASAGSTATGVRYAVVALIAAAFGAGAGYLVRPEPIVETDFVNFDEATPKSMLGEGWSPFFEGLQDGVGFCWCTALRCTLKVTSAAKQDRVVRVRVAPLSYKGAPQQVITTYLNGTKIGTQPVARDTMTTLSFPAFRKDWVPGTNTLTFEFAYAKDPKSVIPGAEDNRQLSASFDWIEIVAK